MQSTRYQVIENNAGGLFLFVLTPDDKVVYCHGYYEYNPGRLSANLNSLDAGDDVTLWDGNDEDGQTIYGELTDQGAQIVAEGAAGKRTLYPDLMGIAAQIEFGVEQ